METFKFEVSVIIPVYNAINYIERAIESVVNQKYIGEIIVVDDGYGDGALEKCLELERKHSKLKVLQHPNGENKGAGESRNLAIKNATCDFIAFLDADDYYLPNRFNVTKQKFEENNTIDMIYEPVGTVYLNEKCRAVFCKWKGITMDESINYTTFPSEVTSGIEFFKSLIEGNKGYPHLNGVTIRRSKLSNIQFNKVLSLHQDTDFLIKFSYNHMCVAGELINPVAVRYVHEENRISSLSYHSRYLLMQSLLFWAKKENIEQPLLTMLKQKYTIAKVRNLFQSNNLLVKLINKVIIRFL